MASIQCVCVNTPVLFLPPPTNLREDNVFTSVCLSTEVVVISGKFVPSRDGYATGVGISRKRVCLGVSMSKGWVDVSGRNVLGGVGTDI